MQRKVKLQLSLKDTLLQHTILTHQNACDSDGDRGRLF